MKTLLAAARSRWPSPQVPPLARPARRRCDPVLEGQLERWLGAGDLIFDNVYTRPGSGR